MIYDSGDWKSPLARAEQWLEKAPVPAESEPLVLARAERKALIEFYAVRKLLDFFNVSK